MKGFACREVPPRRHLSATSSNALTDNGATGNKEIDPSRVHGEADAFGRVSKIESAVRVLLLWKRDIHKGWSMKRMGSYRKHHKRRQMGTLTSPTS